jgi:hypothetical protein
MSRRNAIGVEIAESGFLFVSHLAEESKTSSRTILANTMVLYQSSSRPANHEVNPPFGVTVRHWFEEFRTHLPEDQDVLEHLVQLDEVCFGGRSGKALFLGKQIGTRKIAYQTLRIPRPPENTRLCFYKIMWLLEQC